MTAEPNPPGARAAPVIIEDLFLTDSFLIKGRIANKCHRLTKMLEDSERTFLQVQDATLVALRGSEVIHTPSVMVNRNEIVFAHELVDTASDDRQRQLAINDKTVRIRAFYKGWIQLELTGSIAPGAYEPAHNSRRWYFVMMEPRIRGLDLDGRAELQVLRSLPYVIVRKTKLAYIYDFS